MTAAGTRPHLLVTYDFPPIGGGISRWMAELARHYPPGRLIVASASHPGSAEADAAVPAPVDRIPGPPRRLRTLPGVVAWSRRLSGVARRSGAGFVWCGNLKPAAYAARWLRHRHALPYGILLHGHDLLVLQDRTRHHPSKRPMARALLGSAAALVTNSRFTGALCRAVLDELRMPAAAARVRVVPLGADVERYRPGIDAGEVRARYGLPAGGRWIVTVARLTPHKGIDTTLRALVQLRDTAPELRYLVVGSGAYRAELEALVHALRLDDRVWLLSGVPDADLPALYNLADVYVQVSRRSATHVEGFGIATVEAAACGRPVIAGRSGGMADAVRDGETGLLVDPESPDEIAAAIARLLADPATARALGDAGRRAAAEYYNWPRVARDLVGIGDELACT